MPDQSMAKTDTTLGQRLRAARLSAGYYKARLLAEELGVTANTYYRYERDESVPPYKTLGKISELLNVPLSQLLDETRSETYAEVDAHASYRQKGFSESSPVAVEDKKQQFDDEKAYCSVLAWRLASDLAQELKVELRPAESTLIILTAELYLTLITSPADAIARAQAALDPHNKLWARLTEYLAVYHSWLEKTLDDRSYSKLEPQIRRRTQA